MPSAPVTSARSSGTTHTQLLAYLDQRFKPAALVTPLVPCIYHISGCKKTFDIREELEQHVLRNLTTDKDHEWCYECNLGFADIKAIRHHWVVSPVHEFACPVCAREFKSEGGLQRHIKQDYTKKKEVACLGCQEVFFGHDGAAVAALIKHHMEPGNCKSKEIMNGHNPDTEVLDLAGEHGGIEWPTLDTPKKMVASPSKQLNANTKGKRVSTVRIVDKVSKAKQNEPKEETVSHKASTSLGTIKNADLPTSAPSATPTQLNQPAKEKDNEKNSEDITMRPTNNSNGSGVAASIQPAATSQAVANTAAPSFSYATAIKALLNDEVKPRAFLPAHSTILKPAQPPVSPWGRPRGPANVTSTAKTPAPWQPTPATQAPIATRQPLAPSPTIVTTATREAVVSSAKPRRRTKETYRWSPRAPVNAPRPRKPAEDFIVPTKSVQFEGHDPQIDEWLANIIEESAEDEAAHPYEYESAAIETNERAPLSRPRTPDNLGYDVVLQEYMTGEYVEDDGNWISAGDLAILNKKNKENQMALNDDGNTKKNVATSTGVQEGQRLSERALEKLSRKLFEEQFPAWARTADDDPFSWDNVWNEDGPTNYRNSTAGY